MHADEVVGLIQSGGVHSDIRPRDMAPGRVLPAWVTPGIKDASRKATFLETSFSRLVPHLEKLAGSASGEYFIPEYTPISSQLSYNSCVPNAVADSMEILRGIDDPKAVTQLARMFLWWLCRWIQGTPNQNIGTQNQIAMYALATTGICPEEMYPYIDSNAYDEPTLDCFTVARANRLSAFSRVDASGLERIDQLELSVRANHPFVFATGVGNAFVGWTPDDEPLRPEEEVEGLHDLVGVGVKGTSPNRSFWIRNSYGMGYGDGGHCLMHESYLTAEYTNGIYVGTTMAAMRLG